MLPPDPVTVRGSPLAVAPWLPEMLMLVERAVDARVTVTTAITPGAIVFVFIPLSRHMYEPGAPTQERDFPAAVDASPVTADSAAMSAVE